jgi:hypothetical protein
MTLLTPIRRRNQLLLLVGAYNFRHAGGSGLRTRIE